MVYGAKLREEGWIRNESGAEIYTKKNMERKISEHSILFMPTDSHPETEDSVLLY